VNHLLAFIVSINHINGMVKILDLPESSKRKTFHLIISTIYFCLNAPSALPVTLGGKGNQNSVKMEFLKSHVKGFLTSKSGKRVSQK
jgi:hypothetical protein